MTEEQIEVRVEKMVDHVDARYMSGEMTTEDYRIEMDLINAWAEAQYEKVAP